MYRSQWGQKYYILGVLIFDVLNRSKAKGRIFSEKDWYYLQAQTDMPFHYLKIII